MALEQFFRRRKLDIVALYDKFNWSPPVGFATPEKLNVDKKALLQLCTSNTEQAVAQYDAVQKGDLENRVQVDVGDHDSEFKKLYQETSLQGICFSYLKNFWKVHDDHEDFEGSYPPRAPGEIGESLGFELNRPPTDNDETGMIAFYRLDHDLTLPHHNAWTLNHRFVAPKYRGGPASVGSVMLTTCEKFVQTYANVHPQEGGEQKLKANVAQPRVMLMFLNRGYKAATPEDQRRIDMVLAGDPSLELDYAMLHKLEGDEVQINKDLYCFEKAVSGRTEQDAFRINLEKVFTPGGEKKKIGGVVRWVQARLRRAR